MEPDRQLEIQLGHMCNNRCVFCVSGQRTAMREAFPVAAAPVIEKLAEGRAQGLRKVTLLGGEPTLQPEFLDVVRAAVGLGFAEIVVFTNGVKTARGSFVDEVLATGGDFTWRLSFQGATALAHERTTRKLGSFARLVETLGVLRDRAQRVTANMCVVQSNYLSVPDFATLLLPYGVTQLHLDMVRPLDAGVRTQDELRAMIPRYSDLAGPLTAMVQTFETASPGFDVNIGNLPYCTAPGLAPWIHHDGEATFTVAVDSRDALSEPWDKYAVKRRDKVKPTSCADCVFDDRCSGVFETYARFYGTDELVPITPTRLATLDPAQRVFDLHLRPTLATLEGWCPPAPFVLSTVRVDARAREVVLEFQTAGMPYATVALRPRRTVGIAGTDVFAMHLVTARDHGAATVTLLRALFQRLCTSGARGVHPVGGDARVQSADGRFFGRGMDWRIGQCLARLRAAAPFGALTWQSLRLAPGGTSATASFMAPDDTVVEVTIGLRGAGVSGSYRVSPAIPPGTAPPGDLVAGVRAVMSALRSPTLDTGTDTTLFPGW